MSDEQALSGLTLDRIRSVSGGRGAPAAEAARLSETAQRIAETLRRPALEPATIGAGVAALDFGVLTAAFWVAQVVALSPAAVEPWRATAIAAAAAAVAVAVVAAIGGYAPARLRGLLAASIRLWLAMAAALGVAALGGAWGADGAAAFVTALGLGALATTPPRAMAAAFADWALGSGVMERRAVVVGGGENAERLIRGLAAAPNGDIRVVGIFDDRAGDRSPPVVAGVPKLGTVPELLAFARTAAVDMMIVTLPLSAEQRILSLLKGLWVLPLDVRLSAYAADFQFPRRAAPSLIDVMRRPIRGRGLLVKRAFDLVFGGLAVIALSPVMLATAIAIRLDSPGPILFRQKRHGFNDSEIEIFKFRSMYADRCDPEARSIVTRGDPRVTRVGRFIRRTSIDELPQLFNVISGELSLVGPRPHAMVGRSSRDQTFQEIVDGYSGRHRVKPGITGWAQVNGWRGEVDDPEKLRQRFEHDLYYIENWSPWLDLRILLRTPVSLLRTENAY